jgi:hypothetical protein
MNTPLPPVISALTGTIKLNGPNARALIREARARGKSPDDLIVELLQNIIRDDLFRAVLDD